jgi:hypothetical protein
MNARSIAAAEPLREPIRVLTEQLRAGHPIEDALVVLKGACKGIIQAIGAAIVVLDISLLDARELIETSPAFNREWTTHLDARSRLLARIAPSIEAARHPAPPAVQQQSTAADPAEPSSEDDQHPV